MAFMDQYELNYSHIDLLKQKLKEKLGKATKDEQKTSIKLKAIIEELTERQTRLIKKNLDGFIPDALLKQQLDLIEKELLDAQISLTSIQESEIDIDELVSFAEEYLTKPSSVWRSASLDKKLKLQWFQFPQGIVFNGTNYGTAQVASVFKTKEAFLPPQSSTVDPRRFELLTSALQKRRSTN